MSIVISAGAPTSTATNSIPTPDFSRGYGAWQFPGNDGGAYVSRPAGGWAQLVGINAGMGARSALYALETVLPTSWRCYARALVRNDYSSGTQSLTLRVTPITYTGTRLAPLVQTIAVPAGAERVLSVTQTAAFTDIVATLEIEISGPAEYAAFSVRDVMVLAGTTLPGTTYFSGDTPSTGNVLHRWTGTPGASPSVREVYAAAPVVPDLVTTFDVSRSSSDVELRPVSGPTVIVRPYSGPAPRAARLVALFTNEAAAWSLENLAAEGPLRVTSREGSTQRNGTYHVRDSQLRILTEPGLVEVSLSLLKVA